MRSTSFFLAPLLVACTTSHAPSGSDLQMNDLSVMLPLPSSQAELDGALGPMAPARGGVLLPEPVFAASIGEPISYADLRVVAFRLDPCFGTTDPHGEPAKCRPQLRVIYQPVRFFTDGTSPGAVADDAAVHAFYSLTREELVAAVQDVISARLDDGGEADLGPLAPHPMIVREGLSGPLAQRFDQIITKYAGEANLVRFTTFTVLFPQAGTGADAGPATGVELFWSMHGVDLQNGQATPIEIQGMPSGTTEVGLDADSSPLATRPSPEPIAQDNLMLIANFDQASAATPAQRQMSFDAALRIENPGHHTPDTIDCASCHMAQPSRELVGDPLGLREAGDPNAFVPSASIPAADLAHTTHLIGSDGGLNIHAFSYRAADPMINQRVINETAANVALVQKLLP